MYQGEEWVCLSLTTASVIDTYMLEVWNPDCCCCCFYSQALIALFCVLLNRMLNSLETREEVSHIMLFFLFLFFFVFFVCSWFTNAHIAIEVAHTLEKLAYLRLLLSSLVIWYTMNLHKSPHTVCNSCFTETKKSKYFIFGRKTLGHQNVVGDCLVY